MENKSTMKSRISGGSEMTTYVDVEKFLRSKKGYETSFHKQQNYF
jgi:hypothetical protein